jgi:GR25 family glycosyltransferase involved in LPS biosynthesis
MLSENVPIFVISLESATDRREYIAKNLAAFNVSFSFVDGTTPLELPPYKQNSAIAIWDSHIKTMKIFLASNATFACIFEDDIDLEVHKLAKKNFFDKRFQIAMLIPPSYSILQLGTMGLNRRNFIFVALRELYFLLRGHYRFHALPLRNLIAQIGKANYLILNKELAKLMRFKSKPVHGFSTGMQAYILNRSAAEYLVQHYSQKMDWDSSSRYSMDTYLESATTNSNIPAEIRTIRLSRQLFEQRPIPTSNTYFPTTQQKEKSTRKGPE